MKTTFRIGLGLLVVAGLSLSSCKKDNDSDANLQQEVLVAQDQTEANATGDDVQGTVQQFMDDNAAVFERIAAGDTIIRTRGVDDCALVTIIRSQKKITVDFGTTGCLGAHGRMRKGKWIITYTANWRTPGAVITTNFENFMFTRPTQSDYISVDNSSQQVVTNLGLTDGNFEFKREFNMKSTLPSGQTRTHLGTRYITWNTNQTGYRYDDTFTVKTTSNEYGTDRKGRPYQVTVIEPVITKTACWLDKYYKPVSGVVKITKIGKEKTINYGNGMCGGTITVSVEGGKTYTVGERE